MNTAKTVEAILNKEDKAVDHIIKQNVILQSKIADLEEQMKEHHMDKENIEQELDSVTKSKNILMGYSKNFNEMNCIERELQQYNYKLYKMYYHMYYLIVFNSLLFYPMLFSIENEVHKSIFVSIFMTVLFLIMYYVNRRCELIHNKTNAIRKKLDEIYKATDMVSDLLDSL